MRNEDELSINKFILLPLRKLKGEIVPVPERIAFLEITRSILPYGNNFYKFEL